MIEPAFVSKFENVLPVSQLEQLIKEAIDREADFTPSSTSSGAGNYRLSSVLHNSRVAKEIINPLLDLLVPIVCTELRLQNNFYDREIQITATGDKGLYKTHNDNGSQEIADRALTFVYYFSLVPQPFIGGQLRVYDRVVNGSGYAAASLHREIDPKCNSIVFFKSSEYHEVLPVINDGVWAHSRFTVNGWLWQRK